MLFWLAKLFQKGITYGASLEDLNLAGRTVGYTFLEMLFEPEQHVAGG